MNGVDLLFILLVLGGLALGFFQGTIKLVIAIVSFYVSIVLASLYFQLVGRFFRQRFGTTLEVGQITAFGLILLLGFLLLTVAGLYTFRYAKMPASLDFVDRVMGTLLGLVLGGLVLGIFASLLESLFVFRNPSGVLTWPFMKAFQSAVRSSVLVAFFAHNILPLIYASVRPVLPAEADLIFRVR
ncbi:MAG TPA: CvpA family protein [Roseiflexaceae bacterium]|nr:CvpA family protein [Roseiflexaceae bacterium]